MKNDQIFTPYYIVDNMLDMIGFRDENILDKYIFEPSFGDGNFLVKIVGRILEECEKSDLNLEDKKRKLDYVYGVEIDEKVYNKAIERLNQLLKSYNIIDYEWKNLRCENTLKLDIDIKFDYIIGNPPYIRLHDLDTETRKYIKKYQFSNGTVDMYIIFFELGIELLKDKGKLCYITPNSWMKNTSQRKFRKWLIEQKLVSSIVDYGSYKVFSGIGTYTSIVLLENKKEKRNIDYTLMKDVDEKDYEINVNLMDYMDDTWVFYNNENKLILDEIERRNTSLGDICYIQYGISTNADSIYILDKENVADFESDMIRNVVKGSTLSENYILFPYKWNESLKSYEVITEEELMDKYHKTYDYLLKYKNKLLERDMDDNAKYWYQYARGQGIQNSKNKKFVLKHIINIDKLKCEYKEYDEETLVYSGIYIVLKDDSYREIIKGALESEIFYKYLLIMGKDMQGGYKSINSKIIKSFRVNL